MKRYKPFLISPELTKKLSDRRNDSWDKETSEIIETWWLGCELICVTKYCDGFDLRWLWADDLFSKDEVDPIPSFGANIKSLGNSHGNNMMMDFLDLLDELDWSYKNEKRLGKRMKALYTKLAKKYGMFDY